MKFEQIKLDYFSRTAELFKALSSPVRLQLIHYISFCPRTVEDCAKKSNQSIQNTSLHLINLTKLGVLEVEQIKNFRFYSLKRTPETQLVQDMLRVNQASLLSKELQSTDPVKVTKLKLKRGKIKLIDLRSDEERAYIPAPASDVFSDSLSKFPDFLHKFKKNDELHFLCKGSLCVRLAEAVSIAIKANYKVKALVLDSYELRALS